MDNEGAETALVNGSSSIMSGDLIAAETWLQVAERRIYPWFGRVASSSNPVDQLSHGVLNGDWELVKWKFPARLMRACRDFIASLP